jgi:hypothetical protein
VKSQKKSRRTAYRHHYENGSQFYRYTQLRFVEYSPLAAEVVYPPIFDFSDDVDISAQQQQEASRVFLEWVKAYSLTVQHPNEELSDQGDDPSLAEDANDYEVLSEEQDVRRYSLGLGPTEGPNPLTPEEVLKKQPGQDGAKVRKRMESRAFHIHEDLAEDALAELKKMYMNILLLKANHPG